MKTSILSGTLMVALLLVAITAAAQQPSPRLIPYQGRLTDQQGRAYTNGQFTLLFNLYNQAVGGTPIWTERHEKVGVINGMVNVFLGSITPLDTVDFSTTKHLGITVDADDNPATTEPEMVPRQMIIPSFWSKYSEDSAKMAGYDWSSLLVSGNNPTTGLLRGNKIQPASITSALLAPNSVSSSAISDDAVLYRHLANDALPKYFNLRAQGVEISGVDGWRTSIPLASMGTNWVVVPGLSTNIVIVQKSIIEVSVLGHMYYDAHSEGVIGTGASLFVNGKHADLDLGATGESPQTVSGRTFFGDFYRTHSDGEPSKPISFVQFTTVEPGNTTLEIKVYVDGYPLPDNPHYLSIHGGAARFLVIPSQ